jgi:hypothetical protein
LRNGDCAQARALLIATLATNPAQPTAWLWLSGAVHDPAEQRYCLERALAYDPTLTAAQKGVAALAHVAAREVVLGADRRPPTVAAPSADRRPLTAAAPTADRRPLTAAAPTADRRPPSEALPTADVPTADRRPLTAAVPTADRRLPTAAAPTADCRLPSEALPPSAVGNPWRLIWAQPAAAMQAALAGRNFGETLGLGSLAGMSLMLAAMAQHDLGDQVRPAELLLLALISGPVLGVILLVFGGVLLRSSGGWLAGQGSAGAVRAALAWAGVPLIIGLALWLLQLVLWPQASFGAMTTAPTDILLRVIFGGIHLLLGGWAAWLSLVGLSAAHRFDLFRAALSWLLALGFVIGVGLFTITGTALLIGLRGG